MRATRILTLTLALLSLSAAGAVAQQAGAAGTEELNAAVLARSAEVEQQRAEVRALLARPEVRRVARESGIDIERAEGAVGTLAGAELQRISPLVRTANTHFAAAQSITITTTTIILVLLIIILVILIT